MRFVFIILIGLGSLKLSGQSQVSLSLSLPQTALDSAGARTGISLAYAYRGDFKKMPLVGSVGLGLHYQSLNQSGEVKQGDPLIKERYPREILQMPFQFGLGYRYDFIGRKDLLVLGGPSLSLYGNQQGFIGVLGGFFLQSELALRQELALQFGLHTTGTVARTNFQLSFLEIGMVHRF